MLQIGENKSTSPLLARSTFSDRIDTTCTKQRINGIPWILLDAARKFGGKERNQDSLIKE